MCSFSPWAKLATTICGFSGGARLQKKECNGLEEKGFYFRDGLTFQKSGGEMAPRSPNDQRRVQCANVFKHPVIVTHNFDNVVFITNCYKERSKESDLWIITRRGPWRGVRKPLWEGILCLWKAIVFYRRKALWFADYISPQLVLQDEEAEVSLLSDEVIKRNSRKCHFFSDLAAQWHPVLKPLSPHISSAIPPMESTTMRTLSSPCRVVYDINFFALLRGPIHSFNVLALKMDDIDHWEAWFVPCYLVGKITEYVGRSSSSSEQFQYKQVKNILLMRWDLRVTAMRSCDTFQIFTRTNIELCGITVVQLVANIASFATITIQWRKVVIEGVSEMVYDLNHIYHYRFLSALV